MISTHIKYRSDIDGLRALAVLSVILFHIDKSWIPGGFLGVDIFFVISGYLITLILTREVDDTNTINITNFYKRRIKRIIPALLFVLIPTFIVSFALMAPDDLLNLSKSMIWSFFSAANIYFYSSIDTGYFATGSSELPLLHLWSLGVEEQFYILWPFVVLFLLTYIDSIKKRILIASVLFIVSLVWAQSIIVSNHSFAYYMLFTRAWELLGGAIVALLVHSGFRTKNIINEIMAFIGLLTIILSLIFVSESDPVPGVAALPIIIGTALLILSGVSYKTYVGRILSLKLFVAIGLVSYSAYLWHWPILAFLHYALIDINIPIAIAVILFTFLMATASYFFIETPLRTNNISTKNVFLKYFFVPAVILISVSLFVNKSIKYKKDFIYPWTKLNTVNAKTSPVYKFKYSCQYSLFDTKAYNEQRCVYPENANPANVFLIGDSNAAHYLGMLRVFAKEYGFTMRNATQSACPMIFDNKFKCINPQFEEGCKIYRRSVGQEVNKYSTVIVGVSWDSYYHRKGFKESFKNTLDQLSKSTQQVILLGKVPRFPGYNRACEIRAIRLSSLDCSTRFNNHNKESDANEYLRSMANNYTNVKYFDIQHQLCTDDGCSPYLDGNPVYYNSGHLSMHGSTQIGKKMLETDDFMLDIFEKLKDK
ncbi:MAG: acyltransferase [Bacteroidales bacterium]|nr:acyltransferase [Bacteroidales bacterium]